MQINGNEVTCSTGLIVEMRPMRMKEAIAAAKKTTANSKSGSPKKRKSRKQAKDKDPVIDLVKSCVVSLIDPGPYNFEDDKIDWLNLLPTDKLDLLVGLRALTYGADFTFKVSCSNDDCELRSYLWTIDVTSDLDVKEYPKETLEAVKRGGTCSILLPDAGKTVTYRLQVDSDADPERIRRLIDRVGTLTADIMPFPEDIVHLITQIEGVEERDFLEYLEDLTARDFSILLNEIESHEGGPSLAIEVRCPNRNCNTRQEIPIPFYTREFYLPRSER